MPLQYIKQQHFKYHMWQTLVSHAKDYGFLGPIVGIVGLLLGASTAIIFGWSKALDTWKPPRDTFPEGLERIIGMLSAVGLFVAWILAEPKTGPSYLYSAIYLAAGSLLAFLIYVGLWAYCGRFRRPQIGLSNPRDDVIWGGFWLWDSVRAQVGSNNSIEDILAGNLYNRSRVWPPLSLTLSAVLSAFILIAVLLCGTLALSVAGASVQVALTGKPARSVFSTSQVPGISTPKATLTNSEPTDNTNTPPDQRPR